MISIKQKNPVLLDFHHNKTGLGNLAPMAGIEPATYGLTVHRSTY